MKKFWKIKIGPEAKPLSMANATPRKEMVLMSNCRVTLKNSPRAGPEFCKFILSEILELADFQTTQVELSEIFRNICSRHKIPKKIVKKAVYDLKDAGAVSYTHKPTAMVKLKGDKNEIQKC